MQVTSISMRLKRDVRHKAYNVSQCDCTLTADLDKGEDLGTAYQELHADTIFILEEMIKKEEDDYANKG